MPGRTQSDSDVDRRRWYEVILVLFSSSKSVRIPEDVQEVIREGLKNELESQRAAAEPEIAWASARVTELHQERRRLARGVVTGSIPEDLGREEQGRIVRELRDAKSVLAAAELVYARIEKPLSIALAFVGRCDEANQLSGPTARRRSNQFFFEKLLIKDEEVVRAIHREPWATVHAEDFITQMRRSAANPGSISVGRGSKISALVPPV